MNLRRMTVALMFAALASACHGTAAWARQDSPKPPARKILAELFTSQGCDSCPAASALFASLPTLGYDADRVVPINFHVDYFNDQWVDPFSENLYSRRQASYNDVFKRNDLYYTPLLMVNGKRPVLGSDRRSVQAALEAESHSAAVIRLALRLKGEGARRMLTLEIDPISSKVAGGELLACFALTQDSASTQVSAGENAGKTLTERHVVREFDYKPVVLEPGKAKSIDFPVSFQEGWDPARFRIAAFVQDRRTGEVLQAESIACAEPVAKPERPSERRARELKDTLKRKKSRRAADQKVLSRNAAAARRYFASLESGMLAGGGGAWGGGAWGGGGGWSAFGSANDLPTSLGSMVDDVLS